MKPFLCPNFLLRLLGTRDIFRGQHRQIFGGRALRLCCNWSGLFAGRFMFRRVNNRDLSFSLGGSGQPFMCYRFFVSKIPSRSATIIKTAIATAMRVNLREDGGEI